MSNPTSGGENGRPKGYEMELGVGKIGIAPEPTNVVVQLVVKLLTNNQVAIESQCQDFDLVMHVLHQACVVMDGVKLQARGSIVMPGMVTKVVER